MARKEQGTPHSSSHSRQHRSCLIAPLIFQDGLDRLSALPDELLKPIFDRAKEVWSDGRLGKPLNLSRRLVRFSQQQTYECPTIRTWPRFIRFVDTVVAKPELGALVRGLGLACEEAAPVRPFASAEERVAF